MKSSAKMRRSIADSGRISTSAKQREIRDCIRTLLDEEKNEMEIGRDYERYIGYLYEKDGNAVWYQGIIEGYDDLGRDLIVKKQNVTQVVQCKNWSQDKTIHEKHIFQLYGTVIAYRYDHPSEKVSARFVASTNLLSEPKALLDFWESRSATVFLSSAIHV